MRFLLVLVLFCSIAGLPQTPPKQSQPAAAHPDYSKGVFLGTRKIRIFLDDPRKIEFTLMTSWIPGAEHKGFFRYQLSAKVGSISASDQQLYSATPPSQGWGIPETIDRLDACRLFLNVYDEGGFVLQKIPLAFSRSVDDLTLTNGLLANDSSQMDLDNYQSFLNAKADSSWNIGWLCPPNGKPQ